MEDYKKGFCLLCVLVFVSISEIHRVEGAGECGRSTTPDNEALKLIPCASAAQDENAKVSQSCCAQVQKLGKNPSCLCAVMLSNTAKLSGADPKVAITIPKRCNLPNRPVGYKCGHKKKGKEKERKNLE
ncbi:putative lipid-transfer protein DIR1 isoform X3 [Vigna umbellata]|uniref:putative lipid-transfer protein DIR1 isoform X3 n=1 Tax=Vigna umbellata TaxID=87088 RepID=UPI001F5E974F|nr:putative lipid-transfer protein DIR1 isoform X3 [Vigna umbellata]